MESSMMMMMIMKISLGLLLLCLRMTPTAAGPDSCVGRCGETFTRGRRCTCDINCLQHNECCQDFNAVCITGQSCEGRCGEMFRRGQLCECDPMCVQYNTCCHDYQKKCDGSASDHHSRTLQALRAAAAEKGTSKRDRKWSNSESEEWDSARGCPKNSRGQCSRVLGLPNPQSNSFSSPASPAKPTIRLPDELSHIPVGPLAMPIPSFHAPASPAAGSPLLSYIAQSQGGGVPVSPYGPLDGPFDGHVNPHLVLSAGGLSPSAPDFSFPGGSRPSTLQDIALASGFPLVEGGFEGPATGVLAADNLCSDSPISGMTALSNGTILIFKGEQFWSVDPASHSVSPPQSVQEALGVPSHMDTVFTRCNCEGNTYVIKGDQYWLLDSNMLMESGFPKPLASEFPGLTGGIIAALAVPATRGRPETVYFFKEGDIMQTFSFPPSSTPSCSKRPSRFTRQPEVPLSGEINLRLSLKGFPVPVTSALSLPGSQRNDPYQHYVFSGPLYFRIKISGSMPALAKPDPSAVLSPLSLFSPAAAAAAAPDSANMAAPDMNPPRPHNSLRVWLGCP